jgi:hypothetical protein
VSTIIRMARAPARLADALIAIPLVAFTIGALGGPIVGLWAAIQTGTDPQGTAFYETSAQVAAAVLLAFIIENGRYASRHREARWAVVTHAGLTIGIVESIAASLIAIARNDGSNVLAGVAIGGLLLGVCFLVLSTTYSWWSSAAVAGAFGEDLVVGGGEGGGEGAEEDGVGAEG